MPKDVKYVEDEDISEEVIEDSLDEEPIESESDAKRAQIPERGGSRDNSSGPSFPGAGFIKKINPWKAMTIALLIIFIIAFVGKGLFRSAAPADEGEAGTLTGNLIHTPEGAGDADSEGSGLDVSTASATDADDEPIGEAVTGSEEEDASDAKAISEAGEDEADSSSGAEAVSLDFYVMSQCPYGVLVENAIAPALEKFGDNVEFSLNFIASEDGSGKFGSLHGDTEVFGDKLHLCAAEHYPEEYMDFIVCQNKNYHDLEGTIADCADEAGIDADELEECAEGEEGLELLSESVAKTNSVGARGSPTIYLDGKQYSGGRDTLAFEMAICSILGDVDECADLPECGSDADCTAEIGKIGTCKKPGTDDAECEYTEDALVEFTVINDKNCKACDTKRVVDITKQLFPNMKVVELDYSEDDAQELLDDLGIDLLPAYIFDSSVEDAHNYAQVSRALTKSDDYYYIIPAAVGATHDPLGEDCTNGVDDNDDGDVDCDDTKCNGSLECREEMKGRLDLFVMSQCPYGVKALDAMEEVLDNFGDDLEFHLHFIATDNDDGTFNSLHGQAEVDEDIREACAMKLYAEDYQYMDYIWCRNKDIRSADWEACATDNDMDAEAIEDCFDDEGYETLQGAIALTEELGIGASPTWLANNVHQFGGIDANTIKEEFCSVNPKLEGCDAELTASAGTVSGGCGTN